MPRPKKEKRVRETVTFALKPPTKHALRKALLEDEQTIQEYFEGCAEAKIAKYEAARRTEHLAEQSR